jgi:hypothetical protein
MIDLLRPRLLVSSKVLQVVFVHLVYNSELLLTSFCCIASSVNVKTKCSYFKYNKYFCDFYTAVEIQWILLCWLENPHNCSIGIPLYSTMGCQQWRPKDNVLMVVFWYQANAPSDTWQQSYRTQAQRHRIRDKVMLVTSSQILATNNTQKTTELAA